jgi:hypothetical protein
MPRSRPRGLGLGLLLAAGGTAACSAPYVAPLLPGSYTEELPASYEVVWGALVQVLARENVQVRAIARDSGIIASEAVPTTIGLYADCGRFGDDLVEGDAQVAFTIFVQATQPGQTLVRINTRMRTDRYSRGPGQVKMRPAIACASTGRWEANLIDSVRGLLKP